MMSVESLYDSSESVSSSAIASSKACLARVHASCLLAQSGEGSFEGPLQPPSLRILWRPSRWAVAWGCGGRLSATRDAAAGSGALSPGTAAGIIDLPSCD